MCGGTVTVVPEGALVVDVFCVGCVAPPSPLLPQLHAATETMQYLLIKVDVALYSIA